MAFRLPSSSRRDDTLTFVMAITLVALPTHRIIASYHMPMFSMLYPLRSRSWRQCMGPSDAMKLGPSDCNSIASNSPR